MTITSLTTRADYLGNGVTTVFAYAFRILAASDLTVTVTDTSAISTTLTYLTDYTVSGVGSSSGGAVVLTVPLVSGSTLAILREMDVTQPTSLRNEGRYFASTHETAFDRGVMIAQQLEDGVERSVRLPASRLPGSFDPTLPTQLLPNYAIVINGAGTGLTQAPVAGFVIPITQYPLRSGEVGVVDMMFPYEEPKRFGIVGDGIVNEQAKLTNALASVANTLLLDPAKTYAIGSRVVVPAGKKLQFGTLAAMPGYTHHELVQLAGSRAKLVDVVLDGTNLPTPTAAWLGVGTPIGSLVTADGTITPANRLVLQRVTFQNCASGPVFLRNCNGARIVDCEATNTQSYTANATNAVFEFYNGVDGRIVDCEVNGYNWKAYNMGNCTRTKVVRGHAYGGTQNAGQAAFYEDGCVDNEFFNCHHEGIGAAHKAHNALRPKLTGLTAVGSSLGGYFQACKDAKMIGGDLSLASTSHQAVLLESIATVVGTIGGPIDTALISGVTMRRAVAGVDANAVGVMMIAVSGLPVQHVTVRDCVMEKMFFGVWTQKAAGAVYDDLVLENIETIGNVQYSALLYPKSARIMNCTFNQVGAVAGLTVSAIAGVTGTLLDIRGNSVTGATANAYEIGGGDVANWDVVRFSDNTVDGSTNMLAFDISTNATDRVGKLIMRGNVGTNLPNANSMTLKFNGTTTSRLILSRNTLQDTGTGLRNVVVTNGANVVGGVINDNEVNQITNRPVACGPFLATVIASAALTPGALAAGVQTVQANIAAPGATLGQACVARYTADLQALILQTWVSAPNQVSYVFYNGTVAGVTLAAGTLVVTVFTPTLYPVL